MQLTLHRAFAGALIAGLTIVGPLWPTAQAQDVAISDCPTTGVAAEYGCGTATTPTEPPTSSAGGWTTAASLNTARSRTAVAFFPGTGKFYAAGGEATGGNRENPIEEYDPVADTWTNRATLLTGVSNSGAATVGNFIYVPGGTGGTPAAAVNLMQRFDPVGNSVTAMAPMPAANTAHAVVARGNFVHVLGGSATGAAGTTHFIYNTATDTWATGAALPFSANYPAGTSDGSFVYAFGGNTTNLTDAQRYDPTTDTWTALPSMTTGRGGPGAFYDGENVWAINGGWATYLTTTEYFDGVAWQAGPSTNTGVRTVGAAYGAGLALKAGGWNGAYSAVVERLTLSTGPPVITYTSTDTPLAIPDGNPTGANSVITVPPGGPTIADLDIGFDLTHTWVGDIRAQVTFGATTNAFFDRPGVPASTFGCSGNDADIIADDEGTTGSIENSCNDVDAAPAYMDGGRYTPNSPLSVYDGLSSVGTWTLNVADFATPDPGTLNSWSLMITPPSTTVNTYPSTDTPIAIPDNNPAGITSTIVIPPSSNMVVDLDVDLDITHTWVGDLIVRLTKDATTVTIVDRPGAPPGAGCSGNDMNLVLDDEGTDGTVNSCVSVPNPGQAYPVPDGHYIPDNPLSGFDGMAVDGSWVLNVSDNVGADLGTLNSWALIITEDFDTASPGEPTATEATLRVMPNPMAANGTIELTVPTSQEVRVAVYDMLGREVMVVFDREIAASQRALIGIGANRLDAGVYVIRATGETFTATQRVTVVR